MASFRVALTGGAGSGKSTAAQIFAECGARVVDADSIAHEFMEPGHALNATLRATFGESIADSDGRIMRAALRALVFTDATARKTLEAILHPPIREALRERSEGARPYALIVIPLLAETGRPSFVDRVLVIDAGPETQKRRLRARGLTDEAIQHLLTIQSSPDQRRALADDLIINNGSRTELTTQVRALHARYSLGPTPARGP
ncbi:MAG TPA: dephospho-CoA kinase [Acidiferrobacter sp.]|nr:dephospho-CoA kinase [Acidiferrobacter sp.]